MDSPINELREIAQKYQLQQPEFQFQKNEDKWQCNCIIAFEETIITETQLGQTKKEAKRKAANALLPIIRKLVTTEEVIQSDSLKSRIKKWFKDFRRDWNQKSNIENAEAIVNIFVGFIALITAINAARVYIDSQTRQDEIATRRDLSTYKDYGEYLKTYHETIQPNISQFLNDFEINYIKIPGTDNSSPTIIMLGNIDREKEVINIKESKKKHSNELQISQVKQLSKKKKINKINKQLPTKENCKKNEKYQKQFCFDIIPSSISSSIKLQYYDNIEKEIENKQMAKIVTIHFVNDKQQCEKLKINIGTQENQCFLLNKEGDIKKTNKRYTNACDSLLQFTKTQTGIEVFYSDIFQGYRKIHLFYESLGFGIKNDLIQFNTIFNLFTYPAVWEDDKVTIWASFDPFFELEKCLRDNWFGKDKELVDFSSNFIQLGTNYYYARVFNKYEELNCRRWWQLWRGDNKNECGNLEKKIHLIEKYALTEGASFELYNDPSIWFKTKKILSFMKKNAAEIIILLLFIGLFLRYFKILIKLLKKY